MNPFVLLAAVPLFFFAGCVYLCLLIAVACALASFARRARLRVTLLHRGRIPADGTPLNPDEAYQYASILRGWKERADEPAYDDWSQP